MVTSWQGDKVTAPELVREQDSSICPHPVTSSPCQLVTLSPYHLVTLSVLAILCGFLFLYRLADRDLWNSHEGRAAQDAQSILDEGRWGLPELYGDRPELQKPPLYYWMVAAIAWLKGGIVDAWAVRLPAALTAVGCIIGLFLVGYRLGRPSAGVVAACVLATMVHFTWLARVGRIDMPLTLTVGAALCGFYLAHRVTTPVRDRWLNGYLLVAYLALVVGILLKGPIALVLTAVVVCSYLLIEGELPAPWSLRRWCGLVHRLGLWWGLPLALGLPAVWFLWADARTDSRLFEVFFWHHNVERAFGDSPLTRRDHPWWLYGPLALSDMLPWSLALPVAGWYFWRNRCWSEDTEARFGVAWFGAMFLALSLVSYKRSDYLVPAYPGVALFLGCAAERWYLSRIDRMRSVAAFGLILLGSVIGWGVYLHFVVPGQELRWECRRFAAEVRQRAPSPARVLFFRTESHALIFHVGRPLEVSVEWDRLDAWAGLSGRHYVVMPLAVFHKAEKQLRSGRLELVLSSTDLPGCKFHHTLVLVRTRPRSPGSRPDEPDNARDAEAAADRLAAAQRGPAGAP
jgi:4-amino-4-deoxy-L-arabinose transferase-like glycosyltransferase